MEELQKNYRSIGKGKHGSATKIRRKTEKIGYGVT